MKKLNVGSGEDIRPASKGWVNLDNHDKFGADVIHDLNVLPLPFKNSTFDYLYCNGVLEDFVEVMPIIKEFARITKNGGIIEIRVPNETNPWGNPYHKRGFSIACLRNIAEMGQYKDKMPLEVLERCFLAPDTAHALIKFWVRFINMIPESLYKATFIKYIAPAIFLKARYEVVK